MCEFISWIEFKDKILFLTDNDIKIWDNSKDKPQRPDKSETIGHAAIRLFFGLGEIDGINRECTDFSMTDNFPPPVVKAIKAGKITYGIAGQLLTQPAWAEYEKIRQPAWVEYKKIRQPAWVEYEKIRQSSWAEYEKIRQSTWTEYEKIEQSALAEYKKIEQSTWTEYEKIRQSAWAKYEKIEQPAFWQLFKNPKNRTELWR